MPIPRYRDEKSGMPYELCWCCAKCGWSIQVNAYKIGKGDCLLCGSPTELKRVEYPGMNTRDILQAIN